ncbi:hypothetical protein LTR35_004591 [Friedmanniomyces endolithicus]|nr:hypothetical protein LTR35_004591 [Friedmanniomyces endolithicus]KAK0299058.1 hypothetical protein LTS00_002168 [Friedmanniomyces endolithicus]KAK1017019.1 hypothetical protein LTR54_003060 [Friedmanniomyces endolithicus]
MVTKIELRVHAGAPSDRQSDNRCQTLAAAYLGFTGRVVLHGTGSAQGAAEDASHVLMSDQLLDEVIDGSDPIVLYDESTYVEDTQLAYDALESQLETSSLDVPEATPLKRALPADFDDASQWPEDLDRQSPRIARASLTHDQPSLHHDGSPASGDEGSPVNTQPSKPALHDPGKRPCLQRRAPATSIFKPFQPPLKSGPPDQGRDITPETRTLAPRVGRRSGSGSDLALSQSSYLMTPVLITPTQGAQASSGKQNAVTLQARQAIKQNHRDGADDPRGHRAAEASMLPDYRERTPLHKPHLPYKDLPEGDRAGLALSETNMRRSPCTSRLLSSVNRSYLAGLQRRPLNYRLRTRSVRSHRKAQERDCAIRNALPVIRDRSAMAALEIRRRSLPGQVASGAGQQGRQPSLKRRGSLFERYSLTSRVRPLARAPTNPM